MATLDVVLEGCGARAIAFAGALEAVAEAGHTIRNVTGVSGGALIAALFCAGYSAGDLVRLALERSRDGRCQFAGFLDCASAAEFSEEVRENSDTMRVFRSVDMPMISGAMEETFDTWLLERLLRSPFYCQIFSLVECGGLYSGKTLARWVNERITARRPGAEMLEGMPETLSIIATDQTAGEPLVLNRRTAPRMPVAEAVHASMATPFLLREVVWQETWGPYAGRQVTGHLLIDGLLSGHAVASGNSAPCIHLIADDTLPVPGSGSAPEKTHSLRSSRRVTRTVDLMMRAFRRPANACSVPAATYGATEFDMAPHRATALLDAARDATRKWLAEHLA